MCRPRAIAASAVLALLLLLGGHPAAGAQARVAVAANFAGAMRAIARRFEKDTGHEVTLVTGATGTFCAQIESGAPFDVLVAADRSTPEKLEADGFVVAGSRFTYALGVLALWSPKAGYVDPAGAVLATGRFRYLAIANPKLAPYGASALETLTSLGLLSTLRARIVQGESVAQALELVASGNAEIGFVALSQVAPPASTLGGSYWIVPANLHRPIEQQAVVLRSAAGNAAALALAAYLRGSKARDVIREYHYDLPSAAP